MVNSNDIEKVFDIMRQYVPTEILERIVNRLIIRFGAPLKQVIEKYPNKTIKIILEEIKYRFIYPCLMIPSIFEYFKNRLKIGNNFILELVFDPFGENIINVNETFVKKVYEHINELIRLYNSIVDELGLEDLKIVSESRLMYWWEE